MTPEAVIESLVVSTQLRAGCRDEQGLRAAWRDVLSGLDLPPRALAAAQNGVDVIGAAYARLFTGSQRRPLGQFYTPAWAGDVMAGWVLEAGPECVLDPGVGSGALSISVAQHARRGPARILGVDADPVAIEMADANARLRGIEGFEARVCDFLLDEVGVTPDAVICNPPYSRHHAIPERDKRAIHEGLQRRLGLRLSGLAGMHVLFLVRALELAAPGARLAFITPSDWLDVNYGRKVKKYLLEHACVEAMILIEPKRLFFEGVLTTAAITLIRKGRPGGETALIRLSGDLPHPEDVIAAISRGHGGPPREDVRLTAGARWARPLPRMRKGEVRLGERARVRRGIATGANGFFVLSERARQRVGIPVATLTPCLASPKLIEGDEVSAESLESLPEDVPRWLVDCRDVREIERDTPLGRYLRHGRDHLRVHEGYLASRRRPWYGQEARASCPIVFSYFNRARPRFVRNRAEAVPLNNWLVVEPNPGVDADELFELLASPAFMERLADHSRVYGGGLWKLEPKELEAVGLPCGGGGSSSSADST
ncbi:MAG: N-6 DNA methylase [Thermoleophilia bacterium]|nr:N-6 DNA methylase [Thermoleophilia bacterium]